MAKKENSKALSTDIDKTAIEKIQNRVDNNTVLIREVVDSLVAEFCESLDNYMSFIQDVLNDDENPPIDAELDDFALKIPVLLYFTSNAQETLGIKEDVAKAIRQELYNSAYELATGTVADKTAAAELASQNEALAHIAYSRAYKVCKAKCEAAYEVLNSVKKVISRRVAEYELSNGIPGGIGGHDGK